jgi:hypothetical protein
MGGRQLFFAICALLIAIASFVMNLARTPPDIAFSNLSLWAERIGLHHIPGWLRDPKADEVAFRWARILRIALFIIIAIGTVSYFVSSPIPPVAPTGVPPVASPTIPPKLTELPSIPRTDAPVYGWLKPANHQTPPNGCDGRVPDDATKVLIGTNGTAILGIWTARCPEN